MWGKVFSSGAAELTGNPGSGEYFFPIEQQPLRQQPANIVRALAKVLLQRRPADRELPGTDLQSLGGLMQFNERTPDQYEFQGADCVNSHKKQDSRCMMVAPHWIGLIHGFFRLSQAMTAVCSAAGTGLMAKETVSERGRFLRNLSATSHSRGNHLSQIRTLHNEVARPRIICQTFT